MSNIISPTKSDFIFFEKCVRKWVKKLGLNQWEVNVNLGETEAEAMAQCYCNLSQQTAHITLSTEFETDRKWDRKEIEAAAVHEVLEMMFSKIRCFAAQGISETLVDAEIHTLIQLWTNYLLKR